MRYRLRTLLIVLALGPVLGIALSGITEEKPLPLKDRIQGVWRVVALTDGDGPAAPESLPKNLKLTIKGNRITIHEYPEIEITFSIDESVTPNAMEFVQEGKACLGIIRLKDGALEWVITVPAAARPKQFGVKKGSSEVHEVLKRAD
jgi:uncharacterized protein (TIGR03067 family)